jgi:hypothetical protein
MHARHQATHGVPNEPSRLRDIIFNKDGKIILVCIPSIMFSDEHGHPMLPYQAFKVPALVAHSPLQGAAEQQADGKIGNWGLPSSGSNKIVISKGYIDLLSKEHFTKTLKSVDAQAVKDIGDTHKGDFPNIITMWHAIKLIEAAPSLFPRSSSPNASSTDPYDMVHAFYLLKTCYSKRNVAITKGQDYDSPINKKIRIQNSVPHFPAYGPSGVGIQVAIPEGPVKINLGVGAYHFGQFAAERRRLNAALRQVDTFASEDQIRQFTRSSEEKDGIVAAPTPIGPVEVAHVIHNLVDDLNSEFLDRYMVFEPADMLTNPGSHNMDITQAVSIGDDIAGAFQETIKRLEHSRV